MLLCASFLNLYVDLSCVSSLTASHGMVLRDIGLPSKRGSEYFHVDYPIECLALEVRRSRICSFAFLESEDVDEVDT